MILDDLKWLLMIFSWFKSAVSPLVVILQINAYCEHDVLDQLDVSLCLVSIKADFSCNAVEESIVHVGFWVET